MPTIPTVNPILLSDLTTAEVTGNGVFDVLMQATKKHLEQEFTKGRIKGNEYATVYLGSLEHVLRGSIDFLLQKDKMALDALLVASQIELAQVEKEKALAQLANIRAELPKIQAEIELIQAQKALADQNLLKIPAEIDLLEAQAAHTIQQTSNLVTQKTVLDAQAAQTIQETSNLVTQKAVLEAQAAHTTQQTSNLVAQKAVLEAQAANTVQETSNLVTQKAVLVATECKLRGEYDVLMETKLKTAEEKTLLMWKTATEKSQTLASADSNSVIGRQKELYQAQTNGFARDAEQKAAKILVDSWNVRRTTDSATEANTSNLLDNATVGRFVQRLAAGVGA